MTEDQAQAIENEVQAKGLTAPRVTKEHIDALLEEVSLACGQISDTTMVAHAFLGDFYMGSTHASCASPENFDEEIGLKILREKIHNQIREKLWELEGYRLYMNRLEQLAGAGDVSAETAE